MLSQYNFHSDTLKFMGNMQVKLYVFFILDREEGSIYMVK